MNCYYFCIEYNCIIEMRLLSVCSSIIANSEPHVLENYKIYAVPLIGCKSGQLGFNSSELLFAYVFTEIQVISLFLNILDYYFGMLTVVGLVDFKCSNTSILT